MEKIITLHSVNRITAPEIFIGFITDPDFIIPVKGDYINLNKYQISCAGSEYIGKDLEAVCIKYTYKKDCHGNDKCTISIYVK